MRAVSVLLNARSGTGHTEQKAQDLRRAFREAGCDAIVASVGPDGDMRGIARKLLDKQPEVLVAAGGDGTVGALADMVRGTDTALGVLPAGTFNHFARDLGIPLELEKAIDVIAAGRRARVDVGEVNGRCFVNNASLGLYADLVRERTRQQRRLRRSKRTAMLWATLAMLDRPPLVDLRLEIDGKLQDCRAPFVFVGNNHYVLEGFNIGRRERVDCGTLTVYTTRSCTTAGLVTLALRALVGRLRQAEDFMEAAASALRVESPRHRLPVATDGEVTLMETPLHFRVCRKSLQVMVP